MFFEPLECRRLLSATIEVTAKRAAAYEEGPSSRFMYIRRSGPLDAPVVVHFLVGGKAKGGLDYVPIGQAVTIKAGTHLRRIEIRPIDDSTQESTEAVTLTLASSDAYDIDPVKPAATVRIISNDEPVIPKATTITWTEQAAGPIVRAEALRAVVDGKLYVFGGFSGGLGPVKRSDVYDPATNTWTPIADMPTRLTHAGVAVVGRDVYVAGGYVGIGATGYNQQFGTTAVRKYNVDTNTWTSMPGLPRSLASGGLVAIGRKLHYFGGNDSNRNDASDHYELDLDDTAAGWKARAMLTDPRNHLGYLELGGKIWAIGGQYGNDDALETRTTVSVYDPATNQWTSRAPLPVAISHIGSAAFVLDDGRIVVAGGETDHEVATNRVTAYDPATNTWADLSPLPAARFSGVAAVIGGAIYFTGGSSQTTTWKGVLS